MMVPWRVTKGDVATKIAAHYPGKTRAALVGADALRRHWAWPNSRTDCDDAPCEATTYRRRKSTNGKALQDVCRRGAKNLMLEESSAQEKIILSFFQKALSRANGIKVELAPARDMPGQPVKNRKNEDLLWAMTMLPGVPINSVELRKVRTWVMESLKKKNNFLKTASAATLSALAAPVIPASFSPNRRRKSNPPPTPSSCSGWAAGWRTPKRSIPKRYTPFEAGLKPDQVLSTFPQIDTVVDHIKLTRGLGKHRAGDGPRHADPVLHRRRSGFHSAFAASIPMAHRLRPAADGRRAAHRLRHRAHARPEQSGRAGVH